MKFKVFY